MTQHDMQRLVRALEDVAKASNREALALLSEDVKNIYAKDLLDSGRIVLNLSRTFDAKSLTT
jgi:hypothetical protein